MKCFDFCFVLPALPLHLPSAARARWPDAMPRLRVELSLDADGVSVVVELLLQGCGVRPSAGRQPGGVHAVQGVPGPHSLVGWTPRHLLTPPALRH